MDLTVVYDQWDLSCWANPTGAITTGLPINPRALKVTRYSPTLPGGTVFLSNADSFGPTQKEDYYNASAGTPPSITGTSPATWKDAGGVLAPIYGAQSTVTPLKQVEVLSRHWDATLMSLLTDSMSKTLVGDNLPSLRVGAGSTVDFGNTQYTYDSQGRITSVTGTRDTYIATENRTYLNGQPLLSETTKTLTAGGQPLPMSGQLGKSYTYDATPYRWLKTETDKQDGRATTILERDSIGRIKRVQSPEGVVMSYAYDSWGRTQAKIREAKGAVGSLTTTYTSDPNGAWSEEKVSYFDDDNQAVTLITHTDYDAAGRVVKVTQPDGTYQITQYDGWGQKVLQSPALKPGQASFGNFRWVYDAKGRLTESYDPKGRRLFFQPNEPTWNGGNEVSGRVVNKAFGPGPNSKAPGDPEVSRTVQTDILGQQREITDQKSQLTTFSYNEDGKLYQTDQGGQKRTYSYNKMGWLTTRTEPEEGVTTFESFATNGMPLLTTQKGRSGTESLKTLISLNAWGLPAEVQAWSGSTLSTDRVLTYDPATHWLMSLWESQPNGTLLESYVYDDLGRLASKTVSDAGGQSFKVTRRLNAAGQVSSLTYPTAPNQPSQTVKYAYDGLARPLTAKFNEVLRGRITAYDQVSGTSVSQVLTLGNGTSTTTRIEAGELAEVRHAFLGNAQDNFLKWSTGGLLLFRGPDANAASPVKSDAFRYDELQRLVSATTLSWDDPDPTKWDTLIQGFGYDRWGNRSSESFTWTSPKSRVKPDEVLAWTATNDAASNQLPASVIAPNGTSIYTGGSYDKFGRLSSVWGIPGKSDSQISWTYDASGRIVGESGATFLLDADGLRYRRNQANGSIQYTVYGFNREPLSVLTQPAPAQAGSSGGTVAMMLPPDDGGGGSTPPLAGAFITQPSGPITAGVGQSITFKGSSTYGTTFNWTFGDGGTAGGSTVSHSFTAAGTYNVSLAASGSGYSTSYASVSITVIALPKVTSFAVAPTTILRGESATLWWSTQNATSLSLDNGLGSVTGLTSKVITPGQSGNVTYTLTATNQAGSVTAQVAVYVSASAAPVINSFTASPSAVPAGQAVTLKWNVTQAQALTLFNSSNGTSQVVSGKSLVVYPTATTTYTLTARNGSGTVTASVSVPVIGAPTINRFSASPTGITTGQGTMLSWDVTGAASLVLTGGGYSWTVTGDSYRIIQPSASTTYTLTATNSAGGITRQVSVVVSAPAALAWQRSMVYGLGQLLSEERADVGTVYIQSDQVGSPSLLTDAGGNLIGRTKGAPYGERVWQSGTQSTRRYTNHEDQSGSPIYMQARMYLPAYGRFAQPDPLYDQTKLDPESWNLYSYVTNNPVTYTDPDGRKAFGVKIEGDSLIYSFEMGAWGDVGFLGVSYSTQIMMGWSTTAINWEMNPASIVLDSDGFYIAYRLPYISVYYGDQQTNLAQTGSGIQIWHYDGENWARATNVTSANRFVNGMNNTLDQAEGIAKVEMGKKKISEFDLVHIPSLGFFKDLVRAAADKLGFTTQTAKDLAGIIQGAGPGNWYTHSYGGVAFAEAVRTITNGGGTLSGQSVTFLAGANNQWATTRIMSRAGVGVGGYYGNWNDLVPNIVGLNTLNPFKLVGSILSAPLLATRWSPHTHPPVE